MNQYSMQLMTDIIDPSIHFRNTEWMRRFLSSSLDLQAFAGYADYRFQTALLFTTGRRNIASALSDNFNGTVDTDADAKMFQQPSSIALLAPNNSSLTNLPANHLFAYTFNPATADTTGAVIFCSHYHFLPHPQYLFLSQKSKPLADYMLEYRTSVEKWVSTLVSKLEKPQVVFDYRKGIDALHRGENESPRFSIDLEKSFKLLQSV